MKKILCMITLSLLVSTVVPISSSIAKASTASSLSVSQPLQTDSNVVPGQVIVKYKQPPVESDSSFGIQSISPLITNLKFPEDTDISEKIKELQKDPNVEYAEPVYKFQISPDAPASTVVQSIYFDNNNMTYMNNWGKTVTDLTYASDNTSQQLSSQIVVAVLDTGIDLTHMDLKDSIVPGYDFVHNQSSPQDDNGHGTHVSGIIAAKAHDQTGFTGVAPGTKIMPIKVLDQNGAGTTATIIAGIQYAIDHNANIINLSLGSDGNSKALHDLIKEAVKRNILVVAAAGNEGDNWVNSEAGQLDNPQTDTTRKASLTSYPALYDEVISVGAVEQLSDTSLTVADFSNAIKVDVAAPGVNIYSTFLNGGYRYYSGTSQAAPFVSGLAALIKANNPNLSVENLTSLIENSATPMPNLNLPFTNVVRYGNNELGNEDFYGHGLINGKIPFTLPRLEIDPVFGTDNTVTFNVYDKDIHGTQTDSSFYVTLYNYSSMEDSIFRNATLSSDLNVNGGLVHVVNGQGAVSFHVSASIPDAYHYIFYVEDSSYQKHIQSNTIDIVQKPTMPQSDKNAGSYHDSVQVSLSSVPGSEISYALLNADNDLSTKVYTGPITINKSSTLVAYSLKNHVYSDTAVYNYTIVPTPAPTPVVSAGGGGGGGGGGNTSQPVLDANGKMTYDVQPGHVDMLIDLGNDAKKELTLDATANQHLDITTVSLGADIVQKATEKGKPIVIKTNDVQLKFPANALTVADKNDTVKLRVTSGDTPVLHDFTAASPVLEFSLAEKDTAITTFNTPIEATFHYDPSKVKNASNLGVYWLDESTNTWTYMGGTVNGDGTITVSLPHFSKYAVLEKTAAAAAGVKTFADIQGHWAQKEIEQLVGKQIIDGMSDQSFQPDRNMTRAQLVTILKKALNLPSQATSKSFADVAADSWYKDAVIAAYAANIVGGTSDNTFAPEANVTREQLAVMMVNAYLNATGKKLSDIVAVQTVNYADASSISDWAKQYVAAAATLGLLNGIDDTHFAPTQNSTRAQVATVVVRLLNQIKAKK